MLLILVAVVSILVGIGSLVGFIAAVTRWAFKPFVVRMDHMRVDFDLMRESNKADHQAVIRTLEKMQAWQQAHVEQFHTRT